MSRLQVFDLNNLRLGEFQGILNRGWMIDGSLSTAGGGSTTVAVPDSVAETGWLQLGRMILAEHAKLPAWAGVVDTPWTALLPAQATLYNAGYLLKLRAPDEPVFLRGSVFSIAERMLALANEQEEMYIRLGETSGESDYREETLDHRSFWDQLTKLIARAGKEMIIRPARVDGRLITYVDIFEEAGIDTGYLLHDGEGGNMHVTGAEVSGQVWNRVIGINQDKTENRLITEPQVDAESVAKYRLRSTVRQYRQDVESNLLKSAQAYLWQYKRPRLVLTMDIEDRDETWHHMRLGNRVMVHAAKVWLPDGSVGYRGQGRLLAMGIDETKEVITASMEVRL